MTDLPIIGLLLSKGLKQLRDGKTNEIYKNDGGKAEKRSELGRHDDFTIKKHKKFFQIRNLKSERI